MYAEYFGVGSWLEQPAQFLQWAVYGNNQGATAEDIAASLRKFWDALAPFKAQARTPAQWGDILTLDARSQWELGRLYDQGISYTSRGIITTGPLSAALGLQGDLSSLQAKRAQAYAAAQSLSQQATSARQQAGQDPGQAGRMVQVSATSSKAAQGASQLENRLASEASTLPGLGDLWDALRVSYFGVPLWGWLAGGAALLLLLEAGPGMAAAAASRRAAEVED